MKQSTVSTAEEVIHMSTNELLETLLARARCEKSIITFSGLKPGVRESEPIVIAVGIGQEAERLLGLISLYSDLIEEVQ